MLNTQIMASGSPTVIGASVVGKRLCTRFTANVPGLSGGHLYLRDDREMAALKIAAAGRSAARTNPETKNHSKGE